MVTAMNRPEGDFGMYTARTPLAPIEENFSQARTPVPKRRRARMMDFDAADKAYNCCCSLIPAKIVLCLLASVEILAASFQIYDSSKSFMANATGDTGVRSFPVRVFILGESVAIVIAALLLLLGLCKANKWLLVPHMTFTGGLTVLFLVFNTLLLIGCLDGTTSYVSSDVDSLISYLRTSLLAQGTSLEANQPVLVSVIAVGAVTALLLNIWVLFCLVAGYRYASDMGSYKKKIVLESVPLADFSEQQTTL